MAESDSTRKKHHPPAGRFPSTAWSVVLAAGSTSTPGARQALETLCNTYWFPLYVYVRSKGYNSDDSKDLTQEFFTRVLEKRYLMDVKRERGKFRSFLLAALKHFLANEFDRQTAQKRGGDRPTVSLDLENAEGRYAVEPAHEATPEKIFERQWALTMLGRVAARLRVEFSAKGKEDLFERLSPFLDAGDTQDSYRRAAVDLDMTEGAVKVAVLRLRRRYRSLLYEEISLTVASPEDVDDEAHFLLGSLSL